MTAYQNMDMVLRVFLVSSGRVEIVFPSALTVITVEQLIEDKRYMYVIMVSKRSSY